NAQQLFYRTLTTADFIQGVPLAVQKVIVDFLLHAFVQTIEYVIYLLLKIAHPDHSFQRHQNGTSPSSSCPEPYPPPSLPGACPPACCPSFGQSNKRTFSATTSVIQRVPPSWAWYERVCRRPSTATRRPLFRLWAQTSASLRHVTTVKKSVSRSPCWFVN